MDENQDIERRGSVYVDETVFSKTASDATAPHDLSNSYDTSTLQGKLQRLAAKFKVEQRGIERVPEDERNDNSYWNIGTMVLFSPETRVLLV
jgi:hypothetical protein